MPGLTTPDTRAYLVDLDVTAVALCKEGANSRAHIKLTKKKGESTMTFEEILKALKPEEAEAITKHIAEITKAATPAAPAITAPAAASAPVVPIAASVSNPAPAAPAAEPASQDLFKNADPALILKFKELSDSVALLTAMNTENIAKERYAAVKSIPVEEAKLKEVLKACSPAVYEVLKAASTAIDTAVLTTKGIQGNNNSLGISSGADSAYTTLEKSAKEIQSKDTRLTPEQAFLKACELDPATYAKYAKEV